MDELAQQMARVREELGPSWDETRAMTLYAGVGQRRRRRAVRRAAIGALAVSAVALAIVARDAKEPAVQPAMQVATNVDTARLSGVTNGDAARHQAAQGAAPSSGTHASKVVRLADGSVAELATHDAELAVVSDRAQEVVLDLRRGAARFDVVSNPARRFVVRAGEVEVVVIGTAFDVTRDNGAVRVAVARGRVRVRHAGATVILAAGELRSFVEASGTDAGTPHMARPRDAHAAGSWRSLGQNGDYDGAYRLLADGARVENDAAALMDAADAARLSGHAREAIDYLDRLVREHEKSPLAPLAAFTLGRVYLDQLGEPGRAARAFAEARRLSPASLLAQDALAREVEALSKGGDAQGAHERARAYVEQYPSGRRLRAVRLYGHIE